MIQTNVDVVYIMVYTPFLEVNMQTAKLFVNGRSQAVRLPKEFNFKGTDVFIQKVGESVILFPKDRVWETFLSGLNGFSDDFMADGRQQPPMQEREEF